MNRPSRTDDDLGHPAWNQNPPFLAPDLTTRQDLNGIANARVQRSRCCGGVVPVDEKHLAAVYCDHVDDARRSVPIRVLAADRKTSHLCNFNPSPFF